MNFSNISHKCSAFSNWMNSLERKLNVALQMNTENGIFCGIWSISVVSETCKSICVLNWAETNTPFAALISVAYSHFQLKRDSAAKNSCWFRQSDVWVFWSSAKNWDLYMMHTRIEIYLCLLMDKPAQYILFTWLLSFFTSQICWKNGTFCRFTTKWELMMCIDWSNLKIPSE